MSACVSACTCARCEWRRRMAELRNALERNEPMSVADLAERRRLIAREYVRAEARRQPSPELDLGV